MRILKMYPTSINEKFVDSLVEELRDGGLIIYPTDSYYAIGCDALSNRAVERICALKGINPQKNTLSVVCDSLSQAARYARIDNTAYKIMRDILPGPFTFILPASTTLPKAFKGRKQVGVRVPDNPIACRLAEALGNPLLSTTIVPDGDRLLTPEEIALHYENSDIRYMIDGGDAPDAPTTVVDITDSGNPVIVRQGKGVLES
ncbi:MAG: threonylcarbamoyl-AMP synthase [Muribaculaceae bacterium]|nr:threonylcarbamoyl-AMP synthase [Muribaculaceae bacterium]